MDTTGRFSEWNEGVFKSQRLHDIQQSINLMRSNPLGTTNEKFNYEWLVDLITILFSEGSSKYSENEKKLCNRYKELCEESLSKLPPIQYKLVHSFSDNNRPKMFINSLNLKHLIKLCDEYDQIVKDYNDKHGLTTRNTEEGGWFD